MSRELAPIVVKAPIVLSTLSRSVQTVAVTLDPQTEYIDVRISRPAAANPLVVWSSSGRMSVTIAADLDGVQYRAQGSVSGGVRTSLSGSEIPQYVLRYRLPWGFFGAKEGSPKRLGETGTLLKVQVQLQWLAGSITSDLEVLSATLPAPDVAFHSSVAFDAATDASEVSGDNTVSLTHTATGSDRAAFVGAGNSSGTPQASTSTTYGGNAMTEMWDIGPGSGKFVRQAGYQLAGAGVLTGAQTVTNILAGSVDEHIVSCITMTGVDGTTPVGTPQTLSDSTTTTPSVTVGSVGANDMVVDFAYIAGPGTNSDANCNPGANQTERTAEVIASNTVFGGISTQPGADGGVMSWTMNNGGYGSTLGAVNFIAAGGSPAGIAIPVLTRQYRQRWS